ncbi:hypothetical protein Q1695_003146 [Nippostrongylus brasiliensis]|nr:hypothetical protein Q1695_003146 [Nippostrongylus brasiliensis]
MVGIERGGQFTWPWTAATLPTNWLGLPIPPVIVLQAPRHPTAPPPMPCYVSSAGNGPSAAYAPVPVMSCWSGGWGGRRRRRMGEDPLQGTPSCGTPADTGGADLAAEEEEHNRRVHHVPGDLVREAGREGTWAIMVAGV